MRKAHDVKPGESLLAHLDHCECAMSVGNCLTVIDPNLVCIARLWSIDGSWTVTIAQLNPHSGGEEFVRGDRDGFATPGAALDWADRWARSRNFRRNWSNGRGYTERPRRRTGHRKEYRDSARRTPYVNR